MTFLCRVMNDNWAGSSAFIQAEDSSHQSTDVKRNNPFHLEFGPGFKCRDKGWEFGFLGVPGSAAASSKPFHEDIPQLNSFECLFTAPKAGMSQVIQPQQCQIPKHSPFAPKPRLWKVGTGGHGVLSHVPHTTHDYPEGPWFDTDPS